MRYKYDIQVNFAIHEDYKDTEGCDVLLMDSGDILVGRSWTDDKSGTHGMQGNKCTFVHDKIVPL